MQAERQPLPRQDSTYSERARAYQRQHLQRRNSALSDHASTTYQRYPDDDLTRQRSRSKSGRSIDENTQNARSVLDLGSIGLGRPRLLPDDLSRIPKKFVRRIFGLNPFKTSYWTLYRPLTDFNSRFILFLAITTSVAAGVPLPIIGLIFKDIINSFPPNESQLVTSLSQLLGVAAAYFVLTWTWSVCWGLTGERISCRLRQGLVQRALGMEMAFFDVDAPNTTSILTGDTQTIQTGTSEKVGLFLQSISYFVSAFSVGFSLDAKLTGVLFAAVVPSMTIAVIVGSTAVSKFSKRATALTEKAGEIAQGAVKALPVVQAFGINKELEQNHMRIMSEAAKAGFRKSASSAIMLGSVYFICYAANALAFFLGSQSVQGGNAGTIYAVVFLILDASFVVGQFGPFLQTFALAAASGSNIFKLLDHPPAHIDPYSEEGLACTPETFDDDVTLENVTFVYPARTAARVLDQVNLTFQPHTITGIVGMSGSGKSTIASLLLRLYDPSTGRVRIGENDMKQFNVRQLRSYIGLVDQDPTLFSGTILDNIKYGIPNLETLTDEQVFERCAEAAKAAKATPFISSLPNGIRTLIGGSGGTSLSGGQRQRVCLARALAGRPSMLVLDEPTSALDTTSESLILQALDEVSRSGCTIVMIAHRLSTIQNANNIIVMENGQIMEQGTHQTLMDMQGAYHTLVEAQQMATLDEDLSDPRSLHPSESEMDGLTLEKEAYSEEDGEHSTASRGDDQSTWSVMRRCFRLSRPQRPFIFLGLAASLVSGAIIIGESIIFGNLIHLIDSGDSIPRERVDFFCLLFFIVSLIAIVSYATAGSAFGYASESLIVRVRDISLHQILRQDHTWFSESGNSAHELMASLSTNAASLAGISGVIMGTILSVSTSIIGGIILAHIVAWKIAVVLLAAVPVMILAGFFRLRLLAKSEQRHETAYKEAAAIASESCDAIRTVASLGLETTMYQQYKQALVQPYKQGFKFVILGNLTLAFSLAITYFVYALAYWWGAQQVRDGTYSMLEFFIVLPALLFSAQASGQMFSLAPEITRARSAAKDIFALHDQQPTIMNDENDKPVSEKGLPEKSLMKDQSEKGAILHAESNSNKPKGSHLEFQSVSLTYPTRPDRPVLRDVGFVVEPGEFVGVVGPSGAGKSSVIALIERFYDASSGSIFIDGKEIREVSVQEHRAQMSLVAQDPDLFGGSIQYNVSLGAPPSQTHLVGQSEIEEVCRACGLHDFIMSLPEGYQTECGTNGSNLSGGQKQRVAIARALLRNPSILLLDEATSALDSQNEKDVQNAITGAMTGRTTIMIAHRLASVKDADKIFVFDNGQIVEQGKHDDLVAKQGVYAGMIHAQTAGI